MRIKNVGEIKGFEKFGNYMISEDGKLLNLNTNKILTGSTRNNGYTYMTLNSNGHTRTITAHRLVALTFIPNDDPINKTDVGHIDGNKSNNDVSNLQWISKSDNIKKARTRKDYKKCFVIAEDINTKKIQTFTSIQEASDKLGVNYQSIYQSKIGNIQTVYKKYRFYFNEKIS